MYPFVLSRYFELKYTIEALNLPEGCLTAVQGGLFCSMEVGAS